MRRPLALAIAASALLLGALPVSAGPAIVPCPSWTDVKGDGALAGQSALADPSVDITNVLVEQSALELRVTFTVPSLKTGNEYTLGDRFALTMSAGGTTMSVVAQRDDVKFNNYTGVIVGGNITLGGSVVYDVTKHEVVLTMPYTVADKALAKPFKGLELKSLVGSVRTTFGPLGSEFFDQAPAPTTLTWSGAAVCGDGNWGAAAIPLVGPAPAISAERPGDCFTLTDPKGDAKLGNSNNPNSDPDLDIVGVTMRSTDRMLLAYIKIDKLGTAPATAEGHRFTIDFAFNNHTFTVGASQFKSPQGQQVRETLAGHGLAGKMVQMTVDSPTGTDLAFVRGQASPPFVPSDSKAVFDAANSTVVIGIPIADIQKYGQGPFHGSAISSIVARGTADYFRNSLIADTAPNTGSTAVGWAVGDNKCFSLATKTTLASVKNRAARTVTAKVMTTTGEAVAAKPVTFYLNGKKAAPVLTSVNGLATLYGVKPGTTVKAEFPATSGYKASSATKKV